MNLLMMVTCKFICIIIATISDISLTGILSDDMFMSYIVDNTVFILDDLAPSMIKLVIFLFQYHH